MDNLSRSVIDKIVKDCLNLYLNLPKSGKPSDCEWTVLSCIVQYNKTSDKYQVVSLGTGSKCIGASKMSSNGNIVNDSHAEVFARRGFLLYLYDNILKAQSEKESIFELKNGKFSLKNEFHFIFYSSQLPCGDASIIPKSDEECFGDILLSKKHKNDVDICDIQVKKPKVEDDIHRTGAKCLPHTEQDPKLSGKNYHLVGQVRTKPGRGERTLSVSCSDKIARWIHVGIQGGLLDMLISEPIFIKYFIFGGGVPYSEETMNRAFFNRNREGVLNLRPGFHQSSIKFVHLKTEERSKAASGSIVWVNTSPSLLEVAIQGKKLGVTKKKSNSPSSYLCICKYNLYKKFLDVLKMNQDIKSAIVNEEILSNIQYNEMKIKSKRYQYNWRNTRETFFKTWTMKPDMWTFCIS